jgi:hypothetical protein
MSNYPLHYENMRMKERGDYCENLFKTILHNKKIYCKKSTNIEDRYKHFDFTIRLKKNNKTIDVKAIKKIENKFQDEYYYIEIKNDWNYEGWIYCEYMDLVGFECFDNFMIYKRKDILKYILEQGLDTFKNIKRKNKKRPEFSCEVILIKRTDIDHLLYYRLDKPKNYTALDLPIATSNGLGS